MQLEPRIRRELHLRLQPQRNLPGNAPLSPPGVTGWVQAPAQVAKGIGQISLQTDKTPPVEKKEETPAIIALQEDEARAPPTKGRAVASVSRIVIPPRLRPVGGCLSPHWSNWKREGACAWTIEVLKVGYKLTFMQSSRYPP